jgi:DNA replication protein DnaC
MEDKNLEALKKLKLEFLSENYEEFIKKLDKKPRETILWWLRKELEFQIKKSEINRIQKSKLGSFLPIEKIDWSAFQKPLDIKIQIENLIEKNCVKSKRNIIFIGPEGVGKTMLSKNIAFKLIQNGHSALFTTAASMVNDLNASENAYLRKKILAKYINPNVLILDEMGYISCHEKSADNVFEVISRRYDEPLKSTIVTSNQSFSEWGKTFGNAGCVTSIIDRLVHQCSVINIEAQSFRLKEHKKDNFNESK